MIIKYIYDYDIWQVLLFSRYKQLKLIAISDRAALSTDQRAAHKHRIETVAIS